MNISHPTAKFGGTPLLGCVPLPVFFTDSSTFTPGTAFGSRTWLFGDGTTSTSLTLPMPHTYMAAGLYSPILIVKDFNGCADTLTGSTTWKCDILRRPLRQLRHEAALASKWHLPTVLPGQCNDIRMGLWRWWHINCDNSFACLRSDGQLHSSSDCDRRPSLDVPTR